MSQISQSQPQIENIQIIPAIPNFPFGTLPFRSVVLHLLHFFAAEEALGTSVQHRLSFETQLKRS